MNIKQNILEIIEQGETKDNLFYLPNCKLDRKTYLEVNKVLEYLGGKWNRKFKAHLFESSISDAIDDILLTGMVTDKKKEFQFFETPQDIVGQLIELAEIDPEHKCLEPSAGQGIIAEALRKIVNKNLTCVELMPENVAVLISKGFQVQAGDFLKYEYIPSFVSDCAFILYDRIVMNPPFTKQQDLLHVEKALICLKSGGILVSVMSAGVMFRKNKRTLSFWEKVNKHKYEVIELPKGAFKLSGAMVNTIILKITK